MVNTASFPEQHQRVLEDATDPIHRACDFFVQSSKNSMLDLAVVNRWLHSANFGTPWPDFLVAFASNGCGDYFAYDMRQTPATVIYIDPDDAPEEQPTDPEALRYSSFREWYESQLESFECQRCGSRNVHFQASKDKGWLLRVCSACGFEEPTTRIDP
jgi:hypothetical protein